MWWTAVLGLTLLASLGLTSTLEGARADARRFGSPRSILVARQDLSAGSPVGPEHAELRPWPTGLVPSGALTALPEGRLVAQPIVAGEPVLESRLAPVGATSILPPGTRALALPTGPGRLTVRAGDRVDVLATFDPLVAPAGQDPTVTVARAATVVAVRGQAITVAVSEVEAPRVAFALSQATITLALTPPGTVGGDG